MEADGNYSRNNTSLNNGDELDYVLADSRRQLTIEDEVCSDIFCSIVENIILSWHGTKCMRNVKSAVEDDEGQKLEEDNENKKTIKETSVSHVLSHRDLGHERNKSELITNVSSLSVEETKQTSPSHPLTKISDKFKRMSVKKHKSHSQNTVIDEETEDEAHVIDSSTEAGRSKAEENNARLATGAWKMKIPDEYATIVYTNGCKYVGRVSRRVMEGNGKFYMADGTTYEGDFHDGEMTGRGRLEWADLSWYEGQVFRGHRHGAGLFVSSRSVLSYTGEWQLGHKHGQGLLHYDKCRRTFYDGQWSADMREGHGVVQYPSGSRYAGCWHQHRRHGMGTMVWAQLHAWQMYRGEWRQGEMHGSGTYTWDAFSTQEFAFPQANVYRGRWEQGRQHGPGVLLLGRDASITGNWERGLKHGAATIICSNGSQPAANTVFHYDNLVLDQEESAGTAVGSGAGDKLYNREQNGDILLYAPEHEIDLTFYQELVKTALSKGQDEDEEKHKKLLETALQSDENRLRQVILLNTPLLRQLYYKYSTTACHEQPSYRPVMARIMLWQMFRDIGVQHRNISLVELDQALAENPSILLQEPHDPFEAIFFWQFLHCLLFLAWHLHSHNYGQNILASAFQKLLQEDIFLHCNLHRGTVLHENLHELPLRAAYKLYSSLGEPVSARHCLHYICSLEWSNLISHHNYHGENIVSVDGEVVYRSVSRPQVAPPAHQMQEPVSLLKPSAADVLSCLKTVCPGIVASESGIVVNVNYPLVFIEFYEALLMCARYFIKTFPSENLNDTH